MLKRLLLCGLVVLVALSTAGCFLRYVLGAEIVESLSEEIHLVISALSANATTAVCRRSEFTNLVECTYVFQDPEGFLGETTSTTQLISEFGIFGAVIDPLVLELPAAVTNVAGTFDGGRGNSGDLLVYPGLSFVPVDDDRTLAASPGKQLVIVDLPAGVPVDGVTYQYSLSFEQQVPAGTGPTPVKALLTGRVSIGAKTFYPPVLPCTTDLAAIPSVTLPRSATLEPLALPRAISGCSGEVYRYFRAPRICDLDNDHDVDTGDLALVRAMVGTSSADGDPRDTNRDGVIDAADVQVCVAHCTGPGCDAGLPVAVAIDIKPGSDRNAVNPRSKGVIPVAIVSTATFDATTVDVDRVAFGPAGATEAHRRAHVEDVNGDGKPDLVLHFRTQSTGLACGDTSARLTGMTVDGQEIEGADSVQTVGC